jgi:hypothetical protein
VSAPIACWLADAISYFLSVLQASFYLEQAPLKSLIYKNSASRALNRPTEKNRDREAENA